MIKPYTHLGLSIHNFVFMHSTDVLIYLFAIHCLMSHNWYTPITDDDFRNVP